MSKWKGRSVREKSETQSFYRDFFDIFTLRVDDHVLFEYPAGNKWIDGFWPKKLIIEQRSMTGDVMRTFERLRGHLGQLTAADHPRYCLACNFAKFILFDSETEARAEFSIAELPDNIDKFSFMLDDQCTLRDAPVPVSIKACGLVARLRANIIDSHHDEATLDRAVMRLVFCMFADCTDMFDRPRMFSAYIRDNSHDLGLLGCAVRNVLDHLGRPPDQRSRYMDEKLNEFPHLNGELFNEENPVLFFNEVMRDQLLEACSFDWANVSPTIFGALYQATLDPAYRKQGGVHYTTEENILRVIRPLFIDKLEQEYMATMHRFAGKKRKEKLVELQEELAQVRVFDPACGCGNFLVVAFQQLRRIETRILTQLHGRARSVGVDRLSKIKLTNFQGMDIAPFSSVLAKTTMCMMDHLMNLDLTRSIGKDCGRIHLSDTCTIHSGDALGLDWDELCPQGISYIIGNPPFIGSKNMDHGQRAMIKSLMNDAQGGGTLDYVTGWLIKSLEYARNRNVEVGFVTTSSICQGEQVSILWPRLLDSAELRYAYKPFRWVSDLPKQAHVHVVILGFANKSNSTLRKKLYDTASDDCTEHEHLSPYLFGTSDRECATIMAQPGQTSRNGLPHSSLGSKPVDGQHLIFKNDEEKDAFIGNEPQAAKYIKRYIGAEEFVNDGHRWILALQDASHRELSGMPEVQKRLRLVREFRLASCSEPTVKLADNPTSYHINTLPERDYLFIMKTSTKNRDYFPLGWMDKSTIPSDGAIVVKDADKALFDLLSSRMHMVWLDRIGGKMGEGFRYSVTLVYNTFPLPVLDDAVKKELRKHAEGILDTRARLRSPIAYLYDRDLMPLALRQRHQRLDKFVDRLYNVGEQSSDVDRLELLLKMYQRQANQW